MGSVLPMSALHVLIVRFSLISRMSVDLSTLGIRPLSIILKTVVFFVFVIVLSCLKRFFWFRWHLFVYY